MKCSEKLNERDYGDLVGLNKQETADKDNDEMVRIKIIQSLPDPIMLGDGMEITLEEEDIHFIDKDTADWLVESGVAEVENL